MNGTLPQLKQGDLVYILAPAKAIEEKHVVFAKALLERKGYRVEIGQHCLGRHNYFSGTDAQRLADLQKAIDHPEAKAILCARGGYGCIRIVESAQWANMLLNPKWLIGFSDITVLHQHLQKLGVPSLHATMPLNFADNSPEALSTMFEALETGKVKIEVPTHPQNILGEASGVLLGGNLSIIYSLLATPLAPNYQNSILFIEDIAEQYYHLDRIFHTLQLSGVLDRINGLIIGGMTNIGDTEVSVGFNLYDLVKEKLQYRKIPVVFDFPAGHIDDNRALILGKEARLEVDEKNSLLTFL